MKKDASHPHYKLIAAKKLNPSLVVWWYSSSGWKLSNHPSRWSVYNSYALTNSISEPPTCSSPTSWSTSKRWTQPPAQ